MSMRVITGSARGMKLECPPGMDVRPAPEMARAALFNMLRDEVEGAEVLDLFAGAGTIGIEALSRGAKRCVFVERSPQHRAFIDRNLQHTHLADRAEVQVRDAFRSPAVFAKQGGHFDIIFLGPPFPLWREPAAKASLLALMEELAALDLLKPGGTLVAQSDERDSLPESTPLLQLTDRRTYGRNALCFYTRRT